MITEFSGKNRRSSLPAEAILDAVDRLLPRYGYQKMTMDDIAREAGVSKRTIYLKFANKEEVALASIDRVTAALLDEMSAIARGGAPPVDRIRRLIVARVLIRFDGMQGYYRSFDDLYAALRPAYMARRRACFDKEAAILAEVLAEGKRDGTLKSTDPMQTARSFLLATNSLLPFSLRVLEVESRSDLERMVDSVADLLIHGVRRS